MNTATGEKGVRMKKYFRSGVFAICMLVMGVTLAWSAEDGGWKKIGESDGIVGYTRPTVKSSVDEIKAVGIVDAPVAVVEAVIRDIPSMPDYMFLCKDALPVNTPDMKSKGDVIYFYNVTDLPFPVSDRDAVVKSMWFVDKATGTVYCHAEGLKTTYKQSRDIVRMPLSIIQCILVPKGPNKTEVIYQVLGDPGGELPSWLVRMLTKDYGIKTIAGLRKMVTKEKFRNYKAIVTTTPYVKK